MVNIPIICPDDAATLTAINSTEYSCPVCNRAYPFEDGVLRLLDHNDKFYEAAYENQVRFLPKSERWWRTWPLWLINSGYPWTVRHNIPAGAIVVELGCAGGVRYFGQRYRMVGCDLSLSSLKKIEMYEQRIQADAAACIPLADNTVDAVVSSYFWEHIPPEVKPAILAECHRVLRPSGKIIFLYDVETENHLIRRYKQQDPLAYKRLFIEGDGHLGYESPAENLCVFEKAGFQVLKQSGMEKTWLQSPSVFKKLAEFKGMAQKLFEWARYLGQQPWFYLYTALLRLVDTVVCPWLPAKMARIEMVVLEKDAR